MFLYVLLEVCKGVDRMDVVEVRMIQYSTTLFHPQLHVCDVLCIVVPSC